MNRKTTAILAVAAAALASQGPAQAEGFFDKLDRAMSEVERTIDQAGASVDRAGHTAAKLRGNEPQGYAPPPGYAPQGYAPAPGLSLIHI